LATAFDIRTASLDAESKTLDNTGRTYAMGSYSTNERDEWWTCWYIGGDVQSFTW
jgi:hypothetical protein